MVNVRPVPVGKVVVWTMMSESVTVEVTKTATIRQRKKKDHALIEDRSGGNGNGGRRRHRRLRKDDGELSVGIDLPTKSDIPNAGSHLRMKNRTVISVKWAGRTKWKLRRSC